MRWLIIGLWFCTTKKILDCPEAGSGGGGRRRENGFAFVDHDDCMDVQAIAKLLAAADEDTDIIAGKYKNVLNRYFEQYEWDAENEVETTVLEHNEALDALGSFAEYDVPTCLWAKLYRRDLFERVEFYKYKGTFPLIYFEDTILTPALVKVCRKLKIVHQYIYLHRIDYQSVSMSPAALEFNLQTARAADLVMNWLDEPYARHCYTEYLKNYLLVFSKNWYLVWRYYDKDAALLDEMAALFDRYYDTYRKSNERTFSVTDICIRLFRLNKVFFSIAVCSVWFGCVARMRNRLLAR